MTRPRIEGSVTPDEESLAFEALVVATVTDTVAHLVDAAIGAILTAYAVAERAGQLSPVVARALACSAALRLRAIRWAPMVPALRLRAAEARDLGQERALRRLPGEDARKVIAAPWRKALDIALPPVPDIDRALAVRLGEAAQLASLLGMRSRPAVLAVAGRARAGLAHARGGARYAANEGVNAGTAHVAKVTGRRLAWVGERNACLHCLAHAGWAVDPGTPFPAVSFDPAAKGVRAVLWPPLHPNCRCQVRTYDGPPGPPAGHGTADPASALHREARRSAVLQWSDHASGAAARRAAGALLRAGTDLPVTVRERARRALRSGVPPRRPRA
jgi:hypothetical protein